MNFLIGFNLIALVVWFIGGINLKKQNKIIESKTIILAILFLELMTILFSTGIYFIFKAF